MACEGRCKICLIPLSSLISYGDNLLSHEEDCAKSKIPKRACSKGIHCQATLPYHYKNFSHDVLAKYLSTAPAKRSVDFESQRTSDKSESKKRKRNLTKTELKLETNTAPQPKLCLDNPVSFKSCSLDENHLKPSSSSSTQLVLFKSCSSDENHLKPSSSASTHCDVANEDKELKNLICDIDVNSWSVDDFMDEDTLPLENNDVDQNIESISFEHFLNKLEPTNTPEKGQAIKTVHVPDEFPVLDPCDKDACDIIEEIDNQNFQMCNFPDVGKKTVKNSPKKQVAITSYFGAKSILKFVEEKPTAKSPKGSITSYFGGKSVLKFVEEKPTAKSPKGAKLRPPGMYSGISGTQLTQRTERDVCSNEITSTVTDEPKKGRWSCPFYKKIPGTTFAVDAFCYGNVPGVKHYFLSHFHYDHYRGLTKKFQGPIYCNSITGKLITLKIGIPYASLNILPMEESTVVDNVEVKLLDANHCPGSAMFLFRIPIGPTVLHTGDFRAHRKMESYPDLCCKIDELYLDTTYLDPTYTFPLQEDIIKFVVSLAQQNISRNPKTLFICGSYTIGKEKVFISVAEKLNCKIWASREKLRILGCIENASLEKRLTQNPNFAQIHVLAMNQLNFKALQEHLTKFRDAFNSVLAIKPTGWEYRAGSSVSTLANIKPRTSGHVSIYGIPYSEHSSYDELKKFVKFLRPKKIIPTVSVGNPKKRNEMQNILGSWLR